MKTIYLIHGWGGNPKSEPWFEWLKKGCEKRKWRLIIPEMPETDTPKINEWIEKLDETIKNDNEIYLIGHSIGAQAIMRFLEKKELKVKGIIFVAGWFNLLETAYEDESEKEIAKPWLETSIDYEKVKKGTEKILAIFSNNDSCVPVSDSEIFKEKLNARIIIKENQEHFNDTKQIKEIIDFIEDIFKEFLELLKDLKSEDWKIKIKNKTIKDIVAHMVGWEKECAEQLDEVWETQEEPWFLKTDDYDDFNKKSMEKYKDYSPEELLNEWKKLQEELEKKIIQIGEEKLRARPELFDWVFDEGDNSHYLEHLNQIKEAISK